MNPFSERVHQDILKIRRLSVNTGDKIKIQKTQGNPVKKIELLLLYKTVPSKEYPNIVQDKSKVIIELLSKYPINEPKATIQTPIYHPNVYKNGLICLGPKWLPTYGLDWLVKRIIQIITFDPMILNSESPANREALYWYKIVLKKFPDHFPTDSFETFDAHIKQKRKLSWGNASSSQKNTTPLTWAKLNKVEEENKIVVCIHCHTKNRVPKGKLGQVICGRCGKTFRVY